MGGRWERFPCSAQVQRCKAESKDLTDPLAAKALLASVEHYVRLEKWSSYLFLLMPDHLHALMSFSNEKSMGGLMSDWKGYHSKTLGVVWQDNFFDHRIRTHQEFSEKFQYIQMNPVVKGLCETVQEWPWQSVSSGALAHV